MRVLLINPPRFGMIPVIREERCEIVERDSILPPYSLLQIASLLRTKGNLVDLIDANGENIDYSKLEKMLFDRDYDAIIFRFTPTTFEWDMRIAEISKTYSNAYTIGLCWTLNKFAKTVLEESKNLDIFIMHEYEVVAPALIDQLSTDNELTDVAGIAYRHNGVIKINEDAKPIENYDEIPMPAYDLLKSFDYYFENIKHGQPFTIMYTSKGCPYKCIYCTVANTKWKARSAQSVIEELWHLKKNYNIKTVTFFDETFTIDRKRVEKICQGIIDKKLDLKWYCNSRVDLIDRNIINKMKQSGCRAISLGIESGNWRIMEIINKKTTVDKAAEAIQWVKEAGIKVNCSFILGLPGENKETLDETIEFVKRTLPTGAQFNIAVPYPGTKLYEIAIEKGWIKKQVDFRNMFQHESMMRTDELTVEDLNMARKRAYKAVYLNPKWWIQNICHVIKNPEDFEIACGYVVKIINNFYINKMDYSH